MNEAKRRRLRAQAAWMRQLGRTRVVVIYGPILFGVPMSLALAHWNSWSDPGRGFWEALPVVAAIQIPLSLLIGIVFWNLSHREYRRLGVLEPLAEGSELEGSGHDGEAVAIPLKSPWSWLGLVTLWTSLIALPPILKPRPGSWIDDLRDGGEHPDPDAVFVGPASGQTHGERGEWMRHLGRCIAEPETPPETGWWCGRPASAVVHARSYRVDREGRREVHDSAFLPACAAHLDEQLAHQRQAVSTHWSDLVESYGYEVEDPEVWTTPVVPYEPPEPRGFVSRSGT